MWPERRKNITSQPRNQPARNGGPHGDADEIELENIEGDDLHRVLDGLDRATLERKRHATLPLLREVMQLQLEKTEDEARPV